MLISNILLNLYTFLGFCVYFLKMLMINSGKMENCIFVKNEFCIYFICLDTVGYITCVHFAILPPNPKT